MVIDIIDLTDEAYSSLTGVQLAMVHAAQAKKNAALAAAEQKKRSLFVALLARNAVRSSAYRLRAEEMDAEAQAEVAVIKEDLLYQIAYDGSITQGNQNGVYRYPDNPNYSLAYPQRFLAVREYYMNVTTDADARLQAYSMDTLARSYLGEYYQTLYELLASYC